MPKNERITYKKGMSSKELMSYIKAISIPVGVFLVAMFVISRFGKFGTNLLAPASGFMWLFGAIVAFVIPSQRKETINQTHAGILGYLCGMFLLRVLIGIAAGVSSEQLMASYNQAMPTSTGSTIAGFLQSMLWILAFMTPITFAGMQGKKLITFRRTLSKDKILEQLRGIHENRKDEDRETM